jgi:hypothetical protein
MAGFITFRRVIAAMSITVASLIVTGAGLGTQPAGAATGTVTNLVVVPSPAATGYQYSNYSISFTATDGISESNSDTGNSAIQIIAPPGTGFDADFGEAGPTLVDHTNPNDSSTNICAGQGPTPNILDLVSRSYCGNVSVGVGDLITLSFPNTLVTNPTTPSSNYTLTVSTNNDPTPATSAPYTIRDEGYWLVGSDGGIFTFGNATFYGSTGNLHLNRPVVGITPTADRGGYWLDASDGGVFSFGDTQFYGSIPGLRINPAGSGLPHSLNAPIVGMVPTVDDHGYFMVASDGGVFTFGDAKFEGSCPGIGGCAGSAVAVIPDGTGNGYWLVTDIGDVYAFGDAKTLGAPGNTGSPITSAVRTPDGQGYWILDAAGTVHGYGDAANIGNDTNVDPSDSDPANAIFTDETGDGYGVVGALGGVTTFGGVPNFGGMQNTNLNGAIIAASGY